MRLVQNNALYAAMLDQLDSGIGRVMAALQKNGLTQKTIGPCPDGRLDR